MKALKQSLIAFAAVLAASTFVACSDANEFEDADTNNPSWAGQYNDSLKISHPESMADTYWVRGSGLKVNANGEEIQGYVESMDFIDDQYVVVKMSEGNIPESIKNTAVWGEDHSNTPKLPMYEYTYSAVTGTLEVLKEVKDDKNKVSKVVIFSAVAVNDKREVLTVAHFGDTPVQTYLVKGQRPDSTESGDEGGNVTE